MGMYAYDLKALAALVELGKNGISIDAENGSVRFLMPDGETLSVVKVGDALVNGDAVNLGQLNLAIQAAKDALINGAPATYDTMKELADWVANHQDLYTALVSAVSSKLDASKVSTDINAEAGFVLDAPTVKAYVELTVSQVDNGCRKLEFAYNNDAEQNIGTVIPIGEYVKEVVVKISTIFNDVNATVSIGTDANHELFMANTSLNAQRIGIYPKTLLEKMTVATQAKLFINKGTSTSGAGIVIIEHC